MLTENQEKYLKTIPEDKIASVKSFDPKVRDSSNEIVRQIKNKLPDLEVLFMGASALEIAGQNDIDINVLSTPNEYHKHSPALKELFGEPVKSNSNLIKCEFIKDGFEVEVYLTDKNSPLLREQIETSTILKYNFDLRKQYEKIKLECNGLSFREYMRRKYEFFNKILENERNWHISQSQKKLLDSLFNGIRIEVKNVIDIGSGRTSIQYLTDRFPNLKIRGIVYPGDIRKIDPIKKCVKNTNYELIEVDFNHLDLKESFDIVLAHLFLGEAEKFAGNKFGKILDKLLSIKTEYLVMVNHERDEIDYNFLKQKIEEKGKILKENSAVSEEGNKTSGVLVKLN